MTVPTTIDAGAWLSKYLEGAGGDHDLARSMLAAFAEALMLLVSARRSNTPQTAARGASPRSTAIPGRVVCPSSPELRSES